VNSVEKAFLPRIVENVDALFLHPERWTFKHMVPHKYQDRITMDLYKILRWRTTSTCQNFTIKEIMLIAFEVEKSFPLLDFIQL